MFNSLIDAFGSLLAFFYGLVPNYGVAIILVTVTIRLLLYPLTARQARSMAKMQRVQPEIKKIQEKYKQDRQKLNEELMAFYKEHKINPLAGCLPLVLQFPIFIALFQVLQKPQKHIPVGSDLFGAFYPGGSTKGPPKGLSFLGMDLSQGANDAHGSFLDAVPFFFLIGLVIASGYFQSRQMTRLQKGRATPQSQMMTRIFPVFFGVISYTLPAGVVLYFFVSNLWQIGQQAVVFGREEPSHPVKKDRGDAAGKESPAPAKEVAKGPSGPPERRTEEPPPVVDVESRPADDAGDGTPAPAPVKPKQAAIPGRAPSSGNRPNRAKARKKKKRKRR